MSDDDSLLRAQGRVGTVLGGKYRIDGVLGVGGMAVVFAATHRNQRRVAIKMLHPGISIHREVRERFLREGYAANTVDHPGAVAVLDDDVDENGAAFLVMERLEGDEVDRICQRRGGRLEVQVVMAIADGLLAVLQAAHAKSIVHRDIKPANLYVTLDGTLKVLDFGIARVRDVASGGATATKTGVMLGTPAFMSPEQALSKSSEIDGRSDLWSVGATLFELLSGSLVHEGESLSMVIVQAATQHARPLAAALPGVDPRVAAIVDRALAFDKAARWPDAAAMRAAVRAAYLEMFGVRVGREPLEQLFAEAVGTASTVFMPSVGGPLTPPPPSHAAAPSMASPARAPTPAPFSEARAMSAPPVAVSQASWPANPSSMGPQAAPHPGLLRGPSTMEPTAAPTPSPGDPRFVSVSAAGPAFPMANRSASVPPKGSSRTGVMVAVATVVACGALGLVAWRVSSARASATPAPSTEPTTAVTVNAAPPSVTPSGAPSTADPSTADPVVSPSAAPPTATADALVAPSPPSLVVPVSPVSPQRPAPVPVVVSRTGPMAAPAPVPTPVPTPVYTPPPAPCRSQCTDVARSCKSTCKAQYRLGHDRHQCLVSCETVERDCKSRSPC